MTSCDPHRSLPISLNNKSYLCCASTHVPFWLISNFISPAGYQELKAGDGVPSVTMAPASSKADDTGGCSEDVFWTEGWRQGGWKLSCLCQVWDVNWTWSSQWGPVSFSTWPALEIHSQAASRWPLGVAIRSHLWAHPVQEPWGRQTCGQGRVWGKVGLCWGWCPSLSSVPKDPHLNSLKLSGKSPRHYGNLKHWSACWWVEVGLEASHLSTLLPEGNGQLVQKLRYTCDPRVQQPHFQEFVQREQCAKEWVHWYIWPHWEKVRYYPLVYQ